MKDLSFAFRQFIKSPGLSAVVVLSLALGIGATTTVLCWMRNLVNQPLSGVAHQERIVAFVTNQGGGCTSLADMRDIVAHHDVFVGALATMPTPVSITVNDHAEWIDAQIVSANYFSLLGVRPILGRTFLADEDQKPGGNFVVVISERVWRRVFDADRSVIGRTLEVNRRHFTIIGVVPAAFDGTLPPAVQDLWAPLSMIWEVRNQNHVFLEQRSARGWLNLAVLQPGVTPEQADAAVATFNAQLAAAHPLTNRGLTHRVVPLSRCPWGAGRMMAPVLRLLLVVCAGVLLIVTANVANLLLTRAVRREKEIAIRMASGASRPQLLRMLLVESALLAVAGGGAGILAANWMIDAVPLILDVPPNLHLTFSLDAATLGLTLLVTLATGLLFGLAPAWHAARTDISAALKSGTRSVSAITAHHRLRTILVVTEIALATVLLVGAALCISGLKQARRIDPGFNADHVLLAGMQIGMNGYTPETGLAFYTRVRERVGALPGVTEAALASWFPLGLAGCKGTSVVVEGHVRRDNEERTYEFAVISPRYFATLEIPFLAGRDFTDADDANSAPVVIVNEAFGQRFWPNQNPVGRTLRAGGRERTVVGVVKTGKYNRLDEPASCFFYVPYRQGVPDLDLGLCVRTAGDPSAASLAIRKAVQAIDPKVELRQTMPLARYIQAVLAPQRVASSLLSLLGTVALVLAAMGVYAVIAHGVNERMREFGIRVALGASRAGVLGLVLRDGLVLIGAGLGAGALAALALTRLLRAFLYGVSPFDSVTFLSVGGLLLVTGLLACYLPARRATRVNPVEALHAE